MIPNKDTVLQYIALLTESAGNPPTARVIKNNTELTIGYQYNDQGVYVLTGAENIDWTKASLSIENSAYENTLAGASDLINQISVDNLGEVKIVTSMGGVPTDELLYNTKVKLEIYDI